MPEQKEYKDLTKTAVLQDTDEIAVAKSAAAELETASVAKLTEKVAANIRDGALVEMAATHSAGMKMLAATLSLKGQDVADPATYVQLNNALDKIDAQGSREYCIGNYWGKRRSAGACMTAFIPVPGTEYIVTLSSDKKIRVYDMTDADTWSTAPYVEHDAGASTFAAEKMCLGVSPDASKIVYLKSATEIVLLTVDYAQKSITAVTHVFDGAAFTGASYQNDFSILSDDGTKLLMGAYNGSSVLVNLATNQKSTAISSSTLGGSYHNPKPFWGYVDDSGNIQYIYGGYANRYEIQVNWTDMSWRLVNLQQNTGFGTNSSNYALAYCYPRKKLWVQYSKSFLDGGQNYSLRWMKLSVYSDQTHANYTLNLWLQAAGGDSYDPSWTGVCLRPLNDNTLRLYAGEAGYADFDLQTMAFTSPTPGPDGRRLLSVLPSSPIIGTVTLRRIYINKTMTYVVGCEQEGIYPDNIVMENTPLYVNKIIGIYVTRAGKSNLLTTDYCERSEAWSAMLQKLKNGEFDAQNTVLEVKEA